MLTAHQAYLLGFTPQLMGVFFNGLAVLEGARRTATGELAEKIDSLLSGWVEKRGPEVVKNVHLVEALLAAQGKKAPAPPQSVKEFYSWGDAVRTASYEAAKEQFDGESDVLKKTELFRVRLAHDLGEQMGDISHTYILASLVALLLADGVDHELLKQQDEVLHRSQIAALERMRKVLTYTAGYGDIQDEVKRVVGVLQGATTASAQAEAASRPATLAAVIPALDLARMERVFNPPRPSSPG
jgi:hypothetical protein